MSRPLITAVSTDTTATHEHLLARWEPHRAHGEIARKRGHYNGGPAVSAWIRSIASFPPGAPTRDMTIRAARWVTADLLARLRPAMGAMADSDSSRPPRTARRRRAAIPGPDRGPAARGTTGIAASQSDCQRAGNLPGGRGRRPRQSSPRPDLICRDSDPPRPNGKAPPPGPAGAPPGLSDRTARRASGSRGAGERAAPWVGHRERQPAAPPPA